MNNIVTVRWHDGYLEAFETTEVRFGCDLLWLRLANGTNRHIPLRSVRWFSLSQESHQSLEGIVKVNAEAPDMEEAEEEFNENKN